MKIRGTCLNCGRDFLIQQVLASGGHCWNCGKPYQPHYTALLAESMQQIEIAGTALEGALERMAGMDPALVLDEDTLLGPITAHLRTIREHGDAMAADVAKADAAAAG